MAFNDQFNFETMLLSNSQSHKFNCSDQILGHFHLLMSMSKILAKDQRTIEYSEQFHYELKSIKCQLTSFSFIIN